MDLSLLVENLAQVRARIEDAARRSGRGADEITLVAVTKYVEIEIARALVEAGCTDLRDVRESSQYPGARWSECLGMWR